MLWANFSILLLGKMGRDYNCKQKQYRRSQEELQADMHLKETETCGMEATQFRAISLSIFCLSFLNLWWNALRYQHWCSNSMSVPLQGRLWETVSTLIYIPLLIYSSHMELRLWEKVLQSPLPWKISHHFRLGHYQEDPGASVNFGQETLYRGAGKDPLL